MNLLGPRIYKSAFSVMLALFICKLVGIDSSVMAAVSAFLAIKPSVYKSIIYLNDQIKANLIGGFIAILFAYLLGHSVLVIGLVIILTILFNLKLGLKDNVDISVLTAVAIMLFNGDNFLLYAGERLLLVMIGVISAVIINTFIVPPKYEKKFLLRILEIQSKFNDIYNSLNRNLVKRKSLVEEIEKEIIESSELLDLYKDDWNKKVFITRLNMKRKVILYKEIINVLKKENNIVIGLNQHHTEKINFKIESQMIDHLNELSDYVLKLIKVINDFDEYKFKLNLPDITDTLLETCEFKEATDLHSQYMIHEIEDLRLKVIRLERLCMIYLKKQKSLGTKPNSYTDVNLQINNLEL